MRERLIVPTRIAYGLFVSIVVSPSLLLAQETDPVPEVDQIVVSASRLETRESNIGSSVSVVTQEELQQGRYPNVVQALRKVPGLDIVQSGSAGGNAAAFIRGADSDQTLVLLDGIESKTSIELRLFEDLKARSTARTRWGELSTLSPRKRKTACI